MNDLTPSDIEQLAALFTANGWSEFRVRSGDVELFLSTNPETAALQARAPTAAPAKSEPEATPTASVPDPGWTAIAAPNLGTFYRSPKPGAPVFVNVGDRVTADSEICLLEVMKLFTSVQAGFAGTIRAIAADDAELVEAGRTLFYIKRD